jgi:Flp pilus assembly protein TadD
MRSTSIERIRSALQYTTVVAAVASVPLQIQAQSSPARAPAAADASAEGAKRVERFLASSHPTDPQVRLRKGISLAEQNRPAEAISIFKRLTLDYPELPEPYNNLAVL